MTTNLSRRSLLALGAGLGASTMLSGSALAKAPKLGTQTPYWHRFILGDAEVTVVSDGPLPLGPPKGTFVGVPDEEVRKMLSDNFLNPDNVVLEQNSPIVNNGDKLILFDTGMGTSKAFGPTTGRQQKSMAEAGIKPGDIDAVVLSHAHIDHIGGVVDASGKVLFPNAQYYIAQSDFDYWTDEGKLGSPLKVAGPLNVGSPVVAKPRGAGAGVEGVSSASTVPHRASRSRRNCCCSRRVITYSTPETFRPFSIRSCICGL